MVAKTPQYKNQYNMCKIYLLRSIEMKKATPCLKVDPRQPTRKYSLSSIRSSITLTIGGASTVSKDILNIKRSNRYDSRGSDDSSISILEDTLTSLEIHDSGEKLASSSEDDVCETLHNINGSSYDIKYFKSTTNLLMFTSGKRFIPIGRPPDPPLELHTQDKVAKVPKAAKISLSSPKIIERLARKKNFEFHIVKESMVGLNDFIRTKMNVSSGRRNDMNTFINKKTFLARDIRSVPPPIVHLTESNRFTSEEEAASPIDCVMPLSSTYLQNGGPDSSYSHAKLARKRSVDSLFERSGLKRMSRGSAVIHAAEVESSNRSIAQTLKSGDPKSLLDHDELKGALLYILHEKDLPHGV